MSNIVPDRRGSLGDVHEKLGSVLNSRLSQLDSILSYQDDLLNRIRTARPVEELSLEQAVALYKIISDRTNDTLELMRKFSLHEVLPRLEAVELYQAMTSLDAGQRAKFRAFVNALREKSVKEVQVEECRDGDDGERSTLNEF